MILDTLQKAKFNASRSNGVRSGVLLLLSAVSLSLAACGNAAEETGAGGLSPQDAEALDEAAAKLDAENAEVTTVAPLQNATGSVQPAPKNIEQNPAAQKGPEKPTASAPTPVKAQPPKTAPAN